jgi:S1-C subfamily serine protease
MSGVKIDKVLENSAAHNCGIRSGDWVLEIGKVKITHPLQMFSEFSKQSSNEHAKVKILRNSQELLHTMKLSLSEETCDSRNEK